MLGAARLGLDAGDLFAASYSLFGVEPCEPRELDRVVFENYFEGLRAAGWQAIGARRALATRRTRRSNMAALAFWLRDAGEQARHMRTWERLAGCPMAEYVENQGRLVAYLLDLADEARGLLEQSAVSSWQ